MDDYIMRFGLDFNPFIKGGEDILIETTEYKELQYRLNYLAMNKGIGIVTGEPGRGKTTAIRHYANSLNTSLYKVIYTALSTLTVSEFYKHLADSLGLCVMHKKSDNFKNIQAEIRRYSLEKRITPVIIIDEANHISNGILNDLKMILNFEMDSQDRAILILVGLPQLNNTLRLVSNESLRQRITMNYHVESLKKEDAKQYIASKLKSAHCTTSIFDDNALEAITNAGNGVPRIINKLCDTALMIANSKHKDIIDANIIMQATNEIELG